MSVRTETVIIGTYQELLDELHRVLPEQKHGKPYDVQLSNINRSVSKTGAIIYYTERTVVSLLNSQLSSINVELRIQRVEIIQQ